MSPANGTFGSYATLVYLMPLIGGVVADRYLGARKAVAFGALLMVLGQGAMAIESPAASQVLDYHGQSYALNVHGRGSDRAVRLAVSGHDTPFQPTRRADSRSRTCRRRRPCRTSCQRTAISLKTIGRSPLYVNLLYLALAIDYHGRRLSQG